VFIFSWKTDDFFAHITCALSIFTDFSPVSPAWGWHPAPFLPVRPLFSTILRKFVHKKKFSFGCHCPGGCHLGRSAPVPSDDTAHAFFVVKLMDSHPSDPDSVPADSTLWTKTYLFQCIRKVPLWRGLYRHCNIQLSVYWHRSFSCKSSTS